MSKNEFNKAVEIKYNRDLMLFYLTLMAIISLLFFFLLISWDFSIFITILIFDVMVLPFIIYYLYRFVNLRTSYANCTFQEVLLDNVKTSFLYGRVYFTICVQFENGKSIKKDTKAIFGSRFDPFLLPFDDYKGKRIIVAYNDKTDEVVVIR